MSTLSWQLSARLFCGCSCFVWFLNLPLHVWLTVALIKATWCEIYLCIKYIQDTSRHTYRSLHQLHTHTQLKSHTSHRHTAYMCCCFFVIFQLCSWAGISDGVWVCHLFCLCRIPDPLKVTLFSGPFWPFIVFGLFIDKQDFHSAEHGLTYKDLRTGNDLCGHTSHERNNSNSHSLAVYRCLQRSYTADVLCQKRLLEGAQGKNIGMSIFSSCLSLTGIWLSCPPSACQKSGYLTVQHGCCHGFIPTQQSETHFSGSDVWVRGCICVCVHVCGVRACRTISVAQQLQE